MRAARCCVLFTKTARPGRVKTRLQPVLSPVEAAELHQAFLDDLLPRLAKGAFSLQIAWDLAPGETMPETEVGGTPVPGVEQHGAHLGERLFNGLSQASRDAPVVVAVGSDHPELSTSTVEEAFARLERGADVVVGPAEDGGYYLVGVRRATLTPRLFEDVAWGSGTVLCSTLSRCRSLGLAVEQLPRGRDVDVPEDLDRLARFLRSGQPACPATERVLRRWGRL
jgi:rSAM/selenodomain-associated transferase 1